MTPNQGVREDIARSIQSNRVVLFMKGNPQAPRCGFSAQVCSILGDLGIPFHSLDVLSDPALRDELKTFSNWPTFPQLYIDAQFVGGCDIVTQMYQSGELGKMLGVVVSPPKTPKIHITDAAAAALRAAEPGGAERLRLEITPDQEYDLLFELPRQGDIQIANKGISLCMSATSAKRADGLRIDYVEGPHSSGFKIDKLHETDQVA